MAEQQERGIRYNHFCDRCGYAFSSHKDMIIHRASHSTCSSSSRSSIQPRTRDWARCKSSIRQQGDLTRQMVSGCTEGSSNELAKSYECKICGVKFAWHDNLVRHERSHVEDSCLCNLCGASFGSAASVKVHLWKVHNKSGVVNTKSIVSAATQRSNSKTLKSNTGSRPVETADVKPFHCTTCDQRFQYDFSYNAHMNIHRVNGGSLAADGAVPPDPKRDPERPFACTYCSAQFRYNFLLTAHLKTCQDAKGPITISQFADLVQRGVVGSDGNEIGFDEINVEEASDSEIDAHHDFSSFPDQEITVVPISQLPTSLVNFLLANSDAVDDTTNDAKCNVTKDEQETI